MNMTDREVEFDELVRKITSKFIRLGFKKNLSKSDAISLKNYEMLFKKIEAIQERSFRRKKRNRIYKLGN
tara:strand:- start:236 stop:445 length:210 start_codon:yes stop_codon:yes gene_type:complete